MNGLTWYWKAKLDQGIIVYDVCKGRVYGGSDPEREVKEVERDSDGYYPGGDFTFELDSSNRTLVMEVDNEKITIDGNIGNFEYSPIVIFSRSTPEYKVTLL